MENEQQQPRLTHSSSDNHGVHHVCHKCGWLYPNPHPSAKHRRAHKRICGKVEGYKLFDSEGSTHSNVSDDEHLSDDDHKSPVNLAAQGPKVVEASSVEKGRSESEVFSDAAAEFLDHGVGGRGQGRVEDAGESATKVEKSLKAESNATQSIECGPVAETVKPLGSSSENVQTQHSETPATTSDRSVYVPAFAVSSASFKSNTVVSSVSDCRAEGLAALLDGFGNASVDDLHPIKSETLEAVSRENEKTKTADANVDGSLKLAEQWTDQEGQKETHLVSNLQDVKIPPSKLEGETAGAISKSDKTLEAKPESSPPKPEHDVLQLQEEHRDGFHLKTSKSDVSPEVESGEHANALSDAAEKTVEIAGEVDYVKLRDLVEKKGEVNEDVHVLSVPDDIHIVDNPETMLEDFKDHKVKKFDQSASLECEQAKDKGGDTQGPVLEASSQSSQSEGVLVSSLDKHVLEDSVQLDQRSNARVIKDVLVEGDADLSKLKVGTIGKQKSREANEDVVKPHIEKTVSIFSPEGQGSHDVCSDTLEGKFSQSFDNAISDADSVIASGKAGRVPETHLVSQSWYEKAEQSDLSGDYNSKEAGEVDRTENPITTVESASTRSEVRVDPATNLPVDDGVGKYLKIEGENNDITTNDDAVTATRPVKIETEVDNRSSPAKESCSEQPVVAPVSAKNLSEAEINPETHLISVSGYENAEKSYFSGDYNSKEAREVDNAQNPVTAAESARSRSEIQVNPATNLRDGDDAGNYVKIGGETVGNDDAFIVARPVKNETVVDDRNSPAKKSFPDQPVVAREFTTTCPVKNETGVDDRNTPAKESFSDQPVVARGFATARPAKNETGIDDINSPAKESLSEQPVVTREFSIASPAKNETGVDDINSPVKDSLSEQPVAACEFATAHPANETGVEESFLEQPAIACEFATTRPAKNDTGIDDINSPAKESLSEQPVVAREFSIGRPAKNETGVDDINIPAKDSLSEQPVAAREFATACPANETGVEESFLEQPAIAREFATACRVTNETGVDDRNSPAKGSFSEQPAAAPEFSTARPMRTETGVDDRNSLAEGSLSDQPVAAPEFATAHPVTIETGVDNRNSPESFNEQPVVAPECAKNRSESELNSVTSSQEGDPASSFEKFGTKKDEIMGDSFDAAARHAKDKTGVDNSDSPLKESCSEHPVVIPECARNLAEDKINSEINLQEGDTAGSFEKVEIKKDKITGDASDASSGFSDHLLVTPESAKTLSEVDIYPESNLQEGDTAGNFKVEAQKVEITEDAYVAAARHANDETGVDTSTSFSEENFSKQPVVTPESAKNLSVESYSKQAVVTPGDACDGAARHVKDEAGVDNSKSPSAEIYSKQAVVTPKSAKNLSEVEINPEPILREGDTVSSFGKVEDKKYEIAEDVVRDAKDETGFDNNNVLSNEICLEQTVVAPKSALSEVEVNPETDLREVDIAGIFDKVEEKKVNIIGDACDVADRHAKDESAVDHEKIPSKERCLEQPVVASESAKTVSEVQINSETNLGEGDAAGNFAKAETKKADISGDARDAAASHPEDETGVDYNISPSKEVCSENPEVTPDSTKTLAEVKFNSETDLWERDVAGSFDKVETKKQDISADTCYVTAGHTKDELGVDKSVGPTEESSTEHPIVTLESARNLSDLEVYPEAKEKDNADKFEKVEAKKENVTGDSCAAAAAAAVGPTDESVSENAAVTPESANQHSKLNANPATNSQEGNDTFDPEKGKIEKLVEIGTESKESSVEENPPMQVKTTTESASQTVADDVVSTLDSSRSVDDVVREIHIDAIDHQLDENGKVPVGKEPALSLSDAKSSNQSSTAVEGNSVGESDAASGLGSESFQREIDGQQFGESTNGLSIDSSSQTDSLENNWGSVSVVSVQSEAQAATDADTVVPIESQVATGETANSKESKPTSERQYPDKSEMFEPPSFVTLVEPGGENDLKGNISEIPTGQNSQQVKTSNMQAGWFPSITNVVNESEGRKKNEEIIAKVTNWSTSKSHTPLKNLLGDGSLDTRAKSPKGKDLAPSPYKDDKEASAVNPNLATESSVDQATSREIGNEWNSPARYPAEIKREKRKPKGRPYWAQFMCCSSVH